jgi:O-antigen/teichoic acid export membrane protein
MTTATLAGLITEFGLPVLAMREVGTARATGRWGEVRGLLRWAERTILLLSLALFVVFLVAQTRIAAMQSSTYLAAMLWGVVLIPVVAVAKLRAFVLLALDRVLASQLPVMILRPGLFVLGCLAVWWIIGGLDAPTAMAVQVVGAALALVVTLVLFARFRPAHLVADEPLYRVRTWLATCLPMGLTEGLRLLQGQFALLLTGALASAGAAGVYRVADAVTQMTALVASVVGTAATPLFSRLHAARDFAALERVAILAAWAMLGGTLLLGLLPALAGRWLFPLVFGTEFAASAPVFLILWAGMLCASLGGLALALANMTGHHVLSTQSFAVIAAGNLVLGGLLIPRYGAEGAALAASVAVVAGTAVCAIRLRAMTQLNCTLLNRSAFAVLREAVSHGARAAMR